MAEENTFSGKPLLTADSGLKGIKEDSDNRLNLLKIENSILLQSLDNKFKVITHPLVILVFLLLLAATTLGFHITYLASGSAFWGSMSRLFCSVLSYILTVASTFVVSQLVSNTHHIDDRSPFK